MESSFISTFSSTIQMVKRYSSHMYVHYVYVHICTLEILPKICFQTPDGKVYASTSNDEGRSLSLEDT